MLWFQNGYRRDSTLQMLVYKFMPQMFFESAEKSKGRVDVSNVKTQRLAPIIFPHVSFFVVFVWLFRALLVVGFANLCTFMNT